MQNEQTEVRIRIAMSRAIPFAALLVLTLLCTGPASAAILTYNGTAGGSLQEMIATTASGDTILIPPGTYAGNIVIDRSLTLRALDPSRRPELVARSGPAGVTLTANGIVLDGIILSGNATNGLVITSDNNEISNVSAQGFMYGIALQSAVNNEFLRNTISGNAVGLIADRDSQANTFSLNTFDNTEDIRSSSDEILWSGAPSEYLFEGRNLTGQMGNYWKKYTGPDANHDGIGDLPYPVQPGTIVAPDSNNASAFVDRAPLVTSPLAYTIVNVHRPSAGPPGIQPGAGLPQFPSGSPTFLPTGPSGSGSSLPGPAPGGFITDFWWLVLVVVGISVAGGILFERARRRRAAPPTGSSTTIPAENVTVVQTPRPVLTDEKHAMTHYAAHLPPALEKRYPGAEYVAEGGASRVFRSRDAEGRPVAVKVPIRYDEVTGTQFTKELHVWQGLHHKNIVEIYAANIFPVPYIEMEYVESSLAAMKFPIAMPDAIRIVRGVAEGLRYAHELGIVHRDIKPGNVLIAPDGTPKITDWGLAKAEGTKQSGIIGFSLEYASPEQLAPNIYGEPGAWTDIYQLGVLFYEMLSGQVPFHGDGMGEVTQAILHDEPAPLSLTGPKGVAIEEIIRTCMRKRPKDRYQTVAEIVRDLDRIEGY